MIAKANRVFHFGGRALASTAGSYRHSTNSGSRAIRGGMAFATSWTDPNAPQIPATDCGGVRASALLRHGLHQNRQRFAEARASLRSALVMPEPHDDEVVRGNDQRRLPAGARHVVRVPRHGVR